MTGRTPLPQQEPLLLAAAVACLPKPPPACADCRYFYISIMYNICYTLALYGLILFWNGASELLQPFNPLLKFVLVKTVVFLTFWQVGPALATAGTTQP